MFVFFKTKIINKSHIFRNIVKKMCLVCDSYTIDTIMTRIYLFVLLLKESNVLALYETNLKSHNNNKLLVRTF